MGFSFFKKPEPQKDVVAELKAGVSMCKRKVESIAISADSAFDLAAFEKAANATYERASTKAMAEVAYEVAKLIDEHFETSEVRCMVPVSKFAEDAIDGALPVHFLFSKNGQAKVALVIVTRYGVKTPRVLATKFACEKHGISYQRIFADCLFLADWIHGKEYDDKTIALCKASIVKHIADGLK